MLLLVMWMVFFLLLQQIMVSMGLKIFLCVMVLVVLMLLSIVGLMKKLVDRFFGVFVLLVMSLVFFFRFLWMQFSMWLCCMVEMSGFRCVVFCVGLFGMYVVVNCVVSVFIFLYFVCGISMCVCVEYVCLEFRKYVDNVFFIVDVRFVLFRIIDVDLLFNFSVMCLIDCDVSFVICLFVCVELVNDIMLIFGLFVSILFIIGLQLVIRLNMFGGRLVFLMIFVSMKVLSGVIFDGLSIIVQLVVSVGVIFSVIWLSGQFYGVMVFIMFIGLCIISELLMCFLNLNVLSSLVKLFQLQMGLFIWMVCVSLIGMLILFVINCVSFLLWVCRLLVIFWMYLVCLVMGVVVQLLNVVWVVVMVVFVLVVLFLGMVFIIVLVVE